MWHAARRGTMKSRPYRETERTWQSMASREEAIERSNGRDPNSTQAQWVKIAGVVSLYWFVSISMVFLNKYLLSSEDLKLGAPLFITLSQCVVAVACFAILGYLGTHHSNVVTFPAFEYQTVTALKVLPLSCVFVGMITFNNLTLKFLGVAFYNVGRSLTTVFNVSFSFLILGQRVSLAVLSCCAVIVSGFLLGLKEEDDSLKDDAEGEDQSVHLSVFGAVCGVLASLCVALFAIFTKRTLPHVGDNIWRLQIYNNINAVFLLLPLMIFIGELPLLWNFQYWMSPYFWTVLLVAGGLGIAIGYVTTLQIKVTTPLTHNVSGTAKACAQTILACVVYSQSKPFWWWISNVMVLGGSSAYTYVRMQEMKTSQEQLSPKTLEIIESQDKDDTDSG